MPNFTQTGFSVLTTVLGTYNNSVGALATAGASQADVLIANNVTIANAGVLKLVTAATIDISAAKGSTGLATFSPVALATGFTALYVFGHDGTNWCVAQGAALANASSSVPLYPTLADNVAPVGVMKIVNTSVGDYTAGTTNLDVAGITDTYYDISRIPGSDTIPSSTIASLLGTYCNIGGTLAAEGGGTATVKTTTTMTVCINNVLTLKTAVASINLATAKGVDGVTTYAPTNLATNFARAFLIGWNGSVWCVAEGATVATGATPPYPVNGFGSSICPIGVMFIDNTSVGDYIPGTTFLNVAGVVDTYSDLGRCP